MTEKSNSPANRLSFTIERQSDKLQLTAKPPKPLSGKEREEFEKKHVKVDVYFFNDNLLNEIQAINLRKSKEFKIL